MSSQNMDYANMSLQQLEEEKAATQAAIQEYERYLSQVLSEMAGYASEVRETSYLVSDPEVWEYIISSQAQVSDYFAYLSQLVPLLATINRHISHKQ